MPNPWMPGLRHDPGAGAGYPIAHTQMEFVVHHSTAGSNSYQICKDGREGYGTSLCQILLPKVGVPWQFAEIDSKCYHAGSSAYGDYNGRGPGLEVERLGPGQNGRTTWEDLTEDQTHWLGEINHWLEAEWGIPNVQYRGPQFPWWGASFHGHVSHWDIHPNSDGLTYEEWDAVTTAGPAPEPEPKKAEKDMVIYENLDVTDKDNNSPDGHWSARIGYSLVNITAGEAYVHAIAGVPVIRNLHALNIIAQCVYGAKAQKNQEFWRSKLPA